MAIYTPNQTIPSKTSNGYLWNWLGSPIKKFAAAIQPYLTGGGGGGGGVTEVTYPQLQALVSSSSLVPGVTYKITGFNKNKPSGGPTNLGGWLPEVLYDDGTNSGITIYMQAISATEMATSGYGEFYNPKYTDGNSYYNTDGTGLYQIWDGDNPDPLQIPAYGVGDVVFWGGYAWENLLGNVGTAISEVTLDPTEWEKLPYSNATWYELVTDEIKVDWENDLLVERYNPQNQIRVAFNGDQFSWWVGYNDVSYSPISVVPWGLYSKIVSDDIDSEFFGVTGLQIINSWAVFINFKGAMCANIIMDTSGVENNYFGKDLYINECEIKFFSSIQNNTFSNGGAVYSVKLNSFCAIAQIVSVNIFNCSLFDSCGIYDIECNDGTFANVSRIMASTSSVIQSAILSSSNISWITLENNSTFDLSSSGTLSGRSIQNIKFSGTGSFTSDISAATIIYNVSVFKNIFIRLDGTPRMSYVNNLDVLTIVPYTT